MIRKSVCCVCGLHTKGIGHYEFNYLGLKYVLCGRHAHMVRDFIEKLKERELK